MAANEPKRAKHEARPPDNLNLNLSPSARLHDMTRERIDALEVEKRELKSEVARLLSLVAANARLEEALSNAEFNNVYATILIGGGGFLVSYATFTGKAAETWANFAAGCLLAGIGLLLGQTVRRWHRG